MKKAFFTLAILLLCAMMMTSCDLLTGLFTKKGTVTGYVYDTSNTVVAGVKISADDTTTTATSDSSGHFTIELPEGSKTLHFTKTGYTFYDVVITVVAETTVSVTEKIIGYTPLASGNIRIVLTWGENPRDLDSHLFIPGINDEVYYSHKTATNSSANLDVDDTTSYGPETITISTQASGTYYYSVKLYAGSGTLGTSGAVVKVYTSSGLWRTYNVSSATGTDSGSNWWRVFSLNGSTITSINSLNTTAGTSWTGI